MKFFNYLKNAYQELFMSNDAVLVETRHKGVLDGKAFRAFFDINLSKDAIVVIKFTSPVNFELHTQNFTARVGELKFEACVGGTEGGVFDTTIPAFGMNRTNERPLPYYEQQVSLTSGGTHSGGTTVELVRIKSGGNSNTSSTVGGSENDERILPPGTYYLKFTAVEDLLAVYSLIWEERP